MGGTCIVLRFQTVSLLKDLKIWFGGNTFKGKALKRKLLLPFQEIESVCNFKTIHVQNVFLLRYKNPSIKGFQFG